MAADSEFADYLTMESFFTAESAMAQQQNGFSVPTSQQPQTQAGMFSKVHFWIKYLLS